jgi:hypothetical protein
MCFQKDSCLLPPCARAEVKIWARDEVALKGWGKEWREEARLGSGVGIELVESGDGLDGGRVRRHQEDWLGPVGRHWCLSETVSPVEVIMSALMSGDYHFPMLNTAPGAE